VIVGDVHEGRTYDIRVDPLTSVSARTMDLHNNLVRAAGYAIDNKASLLILLGDVFDRTNVAPIFRELIRSEVIEPLGEARIRVLILAGNHDQPRVFQRGTSIDDFSGYPHVKIFRRPDCIVETVAGRRICFIAMPFLYPDTILDQSGKTVQEVPDDQRIAVSQEILKEFLQSSAKTQGDARVLLAHYYFEGAEVSNDQYPDAEMGEIEFTPSMIPGNIDLAVFGHIHLHQVREARGVPVVFVGALERIDWGERQSPKGFISVDPASMRWKFHELPTREMLQITVRLGLDDKDPTAKILEKIPSDLEGKMVRLIIELPLQMRHSVREDKLAEKLASAFDLKTSWRDSSSEPAGSADTGRGLPDHFKLLESFIDQTFSKHPHKDALSKEGRNILKEALQE
jgi:exonuclease SbcD